ARGTTPIRHPGIRLAAYLALVVVLVAGLIWSQRDEVEAAGFGVTLLAISVVWSIAAIAGTRHQPQGRDERVAIDEQIRELLEATPRVAPARPDQATSEDSAGLAVPASPVSATTSPADAWAVAVARSQLEATLDATLAAGLDDQPPLLVLACVRGEPDLVEPTARVVRRQLALLLEPDDLLAGPEEGEVYGYFASRSRTEAPALLARIEHLLADADDLAGDDDGVGVAVGVTAAAADDSDAKATIIRARVATYEARLLGNNRAAAWFDDH
ncbi:MAG: hypothetical protein OEU32_12380, partial [Acidimicrobiia bacterium]|nr:hypothetical protein [Acidimicrobiia bacterium]